MRLQDKYFFTRADGGQNYHIFESDRPGSRPLCGYQLTGTGKRGRWPTPRPARNWTAFTMNRETAWEKYTCPKCRKIAERQEATA